MAKSPNNPEIEAILTIAPPPLSRSAGIAALQNRKIARTLIAKTRSHSSSATSGV